MKKTLSVLKFLVFVILTFVFLNLSLATFSDGYNFLALECDYLRSNAEISFDKKSLKLIDNQDIKTYAYTDNIYARTKPSLKSFKIDFEVIKPTSNTTITYKPRDYEVHNYKFESNVLFKNVKYFVNNQELTASEQRSPIIINTALKTGDTVSIVFDAKNNAPSLDYLSTKHNFNVYLFLSSVLIYLLVYITVLKTFIADKLENLLVFLFCSNASTKQDPCPKEESNQTKACLNTHKNSKLKVWVNAIFLIVMFCFAFTAWFGFDKYSTSSATDRRELAKSPVLIEKDKVNTQYFNLLNTYLEDRFGLRKSLLSHYNQIISINGVKDDGSYVYDTKSNWFYFKDYYEMAKFDDKLTYDFIKNLSNVKNYLDSQNIKLYTIVVPEGLEVYPKENEFVHPRKVRFVEKDTVEKARTALHTPIIFPIDEFDKHKYSEYVFFKADHHWTDFGAYLAYKDLMTYIQKDFANTNTNTNANTNANSITDIKALEWSDLPKIKSKYIRGDGDRGFSKGSLTGTFNLENDDFLDHEYTYYDPQPEFQTHVHADGYQYSTWHNDHGIPLKVMTMGTSMCENLNPFIASTFKDLLFVRLNASWKEDEQKILKYRKKLIEEYKPDLIVFTLSGPQVKEFTENHFGDKE
ncbi:MAG: hypothetical protein MR830_03380 [Succinatimonas sp.]|nr:hypothetical protein [Succinatimonas sp.]